MRTIKIGTRSSQLALWQANTVAGQLEHLGYKTEIVKIDSLGDVVLDTVIGLIPGAGAAKSTFDFTCRTRHE